MGLDVHSVLIFDKKAVGVRYNLEGKLYDVEIEKLKGVKKEHLLQHKTQVLIPHGNLLVTQEELDKKFTVEDASTNERFCIVASACVTSPPRTEKPSEPIKQNKEKAKGGTKLFSVTVEVEIYNPIEKKMVKQQFTGEFESKSALLARKEAKEYYALENGTEPSEITVVEAKLIQ